MGKGLWQRLPALLPREGTWAGSHHTAVLQGQPRVVVPTDSWAGASAELRVSVQSSSFTCRRAREHGPGPEGPAPLQDHKDSREPLLLAPHWNPHLPPRGSGYKVEGQEQPPPYRGKLSLVCASLSEKLCQPAGHHSSLGTSWGGVQQRDEAGYGLQPRWVRTTGTTELRAGHIPQHSVTEQPSAPESQPQSRAARTVFTGYNGTRQKRCVPWAGGSGNVCHSPGCPLQGHRWTPAAGAAAGGER